MLGRIEGREYLLEVAGGRHAFSGDGFSVEFTETDPAGTLTISKAADGCAEIDLTPCYILDVMRCGVLDGAEANYVNALAVSRHRDRVPTVDPGGRVR